MKNSYLTICFLIFCDLAFGQNISSGQYIPETKLAYDPKTRLLTGYFSDEGGYDENTGSTQFSCVFYIQGKVNSKGFEVQTWYPNYENETSISGTMQIGEDKALSIELTEDHGGCSNVQRFDDGPVGLRLERAMPWIQIRFVTAEKTYFYASKSAKKPESGFIPRSGFVCIEKIEKNSAYCCPCNDAATKGWIKLEDLNKL